jgi:hypothetical protein
MMNSNDFNRPFNPCGNCPHSQNGAPIQKKTKYIVFDKYNDTNSLLEFTEEQVRFVKWCRDNGFFSDDVEFNEVENAEWESI